MTDLRRTAVRGFSWTGLAQGSGYLIQVGALGLVVRHLSEPSRAFGTEVAAATLVGVGILASEMGLGRALIQKRDAYEAHLAAAFWMGLAISCTLAALLYLTARFWGGLFFDDPQVSAVLPAMAWVLVFAGIGTVPRAQLERNFRFGQLAILDVCAAVSSGITMVSLALCGFEVWSLVWAFVVRHAVLGLGPWIFCPFNPVRSFKAVDARVLVGFGGKWTGSRLVGYVQQNLDYLLIGRFLGIEALGYYGLAYRLIAFPQTRVVQAVAKVTFPAFSALQDDVVRLGRAYLSTVKYIAILVFPIMAGFFLLAHPGLVLLFEPEMAPAAVVLQLLSPAGALRSVASPAGLVFSALGRTGLALIWNIAGAVFMLAALWFGISGGITGTALAVSLGVLVLTVGSQGIVNRLARISFGEYLRALYPGAVGSVLMTGVVAGYKWLVTGVLPDTTLVASCVVAGALAYPLALRFFSAGTAAEALRLAGLIRR
ncbi:MAG: lipopolysaccharide biosynthesis protein [Gemmatimonadota bacterium]|nr:lipopolysaccharide biosynthesis protein [Gemmatimonadota bacterium]